MIPSTTPETLPSAVVLTDWGANVDLRGQNKDAVQDKDAVLYDLMLLSLLYDDVYNQDEVFALSDTLAKWFPSGSQCDLLRKLLEFGSVTVLTHPLSAYLA